MSLARSGTRRVVRTNTLTPGSAGPHPPRKTLDDIQQGIKVLYKPADGAKPDCDIVVIPGLGTDPEKSWQSNKTEFNWIKDSKDGLARDFPKARILLFQYESAWSGGLKVKQFIYNIAISLLLGLRGSREARSTTPVVFLGHSMGGLVIAKAIVLADQRRDLVPTMFECISGCIFFGTPFDGCPAASAASMLAVIGEKVDKTTSSKLLDMMKPGDEGLRELKNDFMRLVAKLTQRIELFCFYEEHPTNFAEQAGLPAIFGIAIPKSLAEFVSRDSATLTGIDALGLASNHRNLVKFQGPKDDRYQLVRGSIKPIIQMSHSIAKSRLNATRNIDRDTVLAVKKVLKGPDMDSIRNAVKRKDTSSSWLVAEPEYQAWLHESPKGQRIDAMWIRGQAGRGKTSNTLAVLDDLDARIADSSGDKAPPLVVFYFCQSGADQSTAEDILKSFLQQLIDQQEILVPYAKHFMKKKAKEDSRETQRSALQLTVENMWQTMQDMLYDPFIGTVYFVVNNLHVLPEDSPSTQKLLGLIGAEVSRTSTSDSDRVPVRWLLSSRNVRTIKTALEAKVVRLIDLEDDKYEDQVKKELRRHAYTKVSDLREEKKYERDVAYFAHSLISKKAQNTQWIDIACLQLKALSDKDSRREVRRILETMPQDLNTLLESAWLRVLHKNANVAEKIKEILRALVLTFEDPTGAELSILAGMSSTDEERSELRQLVESCKPLLTTTRDRENDVKVGFMNIVVKTHLLESSKQLLGMSEDETKWQHGMLAFRSFEHITERFDAVVVVEHQLDEGADDTHGEGSDVAHESATDNGEGDETRTEPEGTVADHHSAWADDSTTSSDDETEEFEEADEEEEDPEALAIKDAALAYPVKYWLRHAGSATKEIAEDLITSDDNDFWAKDSQLRRRYLKEHVRLTGRLEGWPLNSLTGLHVAAAFGFPDLVTALIKHGHDTEINEVDDWENAPLHLAACCDRLDIIDVLLDSGAEINHGQEQEVDTPLHMAALEGYVKIMQKLVACGADVNAFAEDTGPVINAAISSGSQEAVELLVSKGANLSLDGHEEIPPPLAAAAKSSNTTLFDFLISACADKLPPREYNLALISAASSGQTEVFDKLMVYRHPQDTFQKAMDAAADETEWSMVKLILERRDGLDCRHVFVEAATAWDDQSEILQAVWQYTKKTLSIDIINEALYHATDYENEDIVRLLLNDFGADANAEAPPSMTTEQGSEGGEGDGKTDDDDDEDDEDNEDEDEDEDEEENYGNALTAAAHDGTTKIVKLLLEKGADVNAEAGWPLQAAAAEGHVEIVTELLGRGVNVNTLTTNPNFEYGTALQAACEYTQVEVVELLLKHKADPNLGAGESGYPLIAATQGGDKKITEMLVHAEAAVNVYGGSSHSTPLINAVMWLPVESVEMLLEKGADITLTDQDGDSALTTAAFRGEAECIELLLKKGADIMHVNNNGFNALQIALQEENEDCLVMLVDAVSRILTSVKTAVDAGNEAVARVLRSAGVKKPANRTMTIDTNHDDTDADDNDENDTDNDDTAELDKTAVSEESASPRTPPMPSIDHVPATTSDTEASWRSRLSLNPVRSSQDIDNRSTPSLVAQPQPSIPEATYSTEYTPQPSKWHSDISSAAPQQSHSQQWQTQDVPRYDTIPVPPVQPAIRRKPTPSTSSPSSRPSSVGQGQPASTPPPLPSRNYQHESPQHLGQSTPETQSQSRYHNTVSDPDARNDSYQAYDYNVPPAPRYQHQVANGQSQSYGAPSSSQSYQPYNTSSNGPGYAAYQYDNRSTSYGRQSQPGPQPHYQQPQANAYDGSDYDTTSWQRPPPRPDLEQRSSSSSMTGMKDVFGRAKQYGVNRWMS